MTINNWTPEQPIVSLNNVYKSFGELEVLKGISFDVMKGEVICIIGPSGSGKSTLIRCINALNDINSGSIKVHGLEVNDSNLNKLELRKNVGMVFQQYNLFPHKTALENIMMAPELVLKEAKEDVLVKAQALIRKVRLEDKQNNYPAELSGGQQQRVAIARALVSDPDILVCDEPTGDLDRNTATEILDLLQILNRDHGKTILMVTHDPVAAEFAKRTLHLDKGKLTD